MNMTANQSLILFINIIFVCTCIHAESQESILTFEGSGIFRHGINGHRYVDSCKYNLHLQVSKQGWEILCLHDDTSDVRTAPENTPLRKQTQSIKYSAFYITNIMNYWDQVNKPTETQTMP